MEIAIGFLSPPSHPLCRVWENVFTYKTHRMWCTFSLLGTAYAGPSVSGCTGTETDKQIGMWERRIKGLRRMLLGYDQTKPPDAPSFVGIDVTSINSANLRIQESGEGPISTKFKGKSNTHRIFLHPTIRQCMSWRK